MVIEETLTQGKLVKRYKRFLADITLENNLVTAHCPNSGSMKGLVNPGNSVWISTSTNKARKLPYTLEMIQVDGVYVGVNTRKPNQIVAHALKQKKIKSLSQYNAIREEVKYGTNSRIDILLQQESLPDAYIEVKNVTLKEGDAALFPDAVTSRGTKHLNELINMKKIGARAIMFYLVQRNDCRFFSPARKIDPLYAQTLEKAMDAGVEVMIYPCSVSPQEIKLEVTNPLPFKTEVHETNTE
ncbi:MAG: DNA/RNA nuclease SfsA [Holosporaceae bacterium]|nr:MAG: DNA/RNA nuclease SfsA [Holosporaceae bacterium]